MILEASIFVVFLIITALVLYARWNFGTLEKMGLKTDPYHFILGNSPDYFDKIIPLEDIRRFEQYGEVYGFYHGRQPQIHICDPEMVREIMIKNADCFNGKRELDFGSAILNEMPDFQPLEKWRTVRGFMTPCFTSLRLKLMSEGMSASIDEYVNLLKTKVEQNEAKQYDLREGIWLMLTDLIARVCFNFKIRNPEDPNNIFAKLVRDVFDMNSSQSLIFNIIDRLRYSFPFLPKLFSGYGMIFNTESSDNCCAILENLIQERKKSGKTANDIVDMMIEQLDKVENDDSYKRIGITKETVLCQGLVFYFAGQDQISSICAYAIYHIFKNEKYLEKVRKEVDQVFEENGNKLDHESILKMPFLNACILEAGRLVPFFARTERICTKDWSYKNYHFKKGQVVIFPIWAINRNPKYFKDPYNFNPTHFYENADLHPTANCTFGHGPRNCIGMRFSLNVSVLLAANLIRKFDFDTLENLDINKMWVPGGEFFARALPYHMEITMRKEE